MKIKESKITGIVSWCPIPKYPDMLAVGTVAGSISDNFSSDSILQLQSLDTGNTSVCAEVLGEVSITDKLQRLDWSSIGLGEFGTIAGGLMDGTVCLWNADQIIGKIATEVHNNDPFNADTNYGSEEPSDVYIPIKIDAYKGAVRGCQFSPMEPSLLAIGGDKELRIYSIDSNIQYKEIPAINKGALHTSDITDLKWNTKVKHIIATTTISGIVNIWDLKAKKSALQFRISQEMSSSTTLAWHPSCATYLAIAKSEPNPCVQIWDVRKAVTPIITMQGHQKTIQGLSWNTYDTSILTSVSSDGRTIHWDTNTGNYIGELEPSHNLHYETKWAPHHPSLISVSSFDTVASIFEAHDIASVNIHKQYKAPNWMMPPCRASFGFGARIVQATQKKVKIIQVKSLTSPIIENEIKFQKDILNVAIKSDECISLLDTYTWKVLSALTQSKVDASRKPLLNYINRSSNAPTIEDEYHTSDIDNDLTQFLLTGDVSKAIELAIKTKRFDDAFGFAYMAGNDLVSHVHTEYLKHKSKEHKYAQFLSAITLDNIGDLLILNLNTDQESTDKLRYHWYEILAVIVSYSPPGTYSSRCSMLGKVLEESENFEEAYTCYIFGSNIDSASHVLSKIKHNDIPAYIHQIMLLEHILESKCNDVLFSEYLAYYAETLVHAGQFKIALSYAQKSAALNSAQGKVLLNRIQMHIQKVKPVPQMQQSVPQMQQSVPQMQQSVPQMQQSVPQMQQSVPQMQQSVPQMQQSVPQMQQSVPQMQQSVPQMQQSVPQMQQSVPQMQQSVPQMQQSVPQMQQSVPQMQQSVPQMQQSVPQMQQSVPQMQQSVPQMQQSVLQMQQSVPQMQQSVPQMQQSVPQMQQSVPQMQQSVPQMQQSVPQMQQSVPQMQQSVPQMQQSVPQMQQSVPQMQQSVPQMQQSVPQMQQSVPQMQQSVPQMQQSVPQMQQSVPQMQQSVPQMQQSVPQMQQSVLQMQQSVPQMQQSVPQMQQSVPQMQQSVPQMQQSVPQMQQSVPQMQQSVPQMQQSVPQKLSVPKNENYRGNKVNLVSLDTSSLPSNYQSLLSSIEILIKNITEKRRKEAIEKAAIALSKELISGSISEELGNLLCTWIGNISNSNIMAAKEVWKEIADKYWESIQSFHNIKFLS